MYYKKSVEEVLTSLNSNLDSITEEEAKKRLDIYGFNKINEEEKKSKISIFLKQFKDAMIIMLLIVSLISFIYSYITNSSYTDSILIIFIVIINALMQFIQQLKADSSIESLKEVNKCFITVKRNSKQLVIDSYMLVPGDIIILQSGDKIPADARVIESISAKVDESLLTGESMSVLKIKDPINEDVLINDRKNMLYSGCNVTCGKLVAVVTKTGMNTELGKIAKSVTERIDFPTPLQKKTSEISKNLSIICFFIVAIILIYNIFILHSEILNVIMLCISIMVSIVPEGLPVVISISLSLGVREMSKKNALVKTLSSVETLGATNVICSDKTGTITKNQMTVVKIVNNFKIYDVKEIKKCDINMINNMILCNDSKIIDKKIIGDSTETSLIEFVNNIYPNILNKVSKYEKQADIPFDSNRKMMSVVANIDNKNILYSKGSLESVLDRCKYYESDGNIFTFTNDKKQELFDIEKKLAEDSLRVIGFAYKSIDKIEYKDKNSQDLFYLEDNLIFSGMACMIDPPRDDVKEAISLCKQASITPIMITGDNLDTALAISREIGLIDSKSEGIEGKMLSNYSIEQMVDIVKKYKVYARVSPSDKVKIVEALKKNGNIVAMTGDGVNDAPALKIADIGIGMGINGTEVTKSVADIILLDDSFSTIVTAIKEGRRIYNNIRNVILYSLSSNFAEIFIVLVGMLLSNNILLPIQILYIDLVTDAVLSICLAFENSSKNIMKQKPHKSSNKFFTPFTTTFLIISSLIESLIIFLVYEIGINNYSYDIVQSMAFLCLIVQEMTFAINCRNIKEPLAKHGIFTNKYMNIGIVVLSIIQILVFVSPIRNLLHITSLNINQVLIIVVINLIVFIIIEIIKPIMAKHIKDYT